MLKFNPENKPFDQLDALNDCLAPMMEIKDKEEAIKYFHDYSTFLYAIGPNISNIEEAEKIARKNIGYYTGYFTHEERARVEDLYECEHPIFGSIKEMGVPTPTESMQCGIKKITLKELRKIKNGTEK